MGRGVWYIVAVGLVIIVAVGVTGEYSVRSATCMACHSQEASFAQWMAGRLKAEKKGFAHELIACADCHIQGSAAGTPVSRLRGLLHIVSYVVPQIEPRQAATRRAVQQNAYSKRKLPVLSFGGDIPQRGLSQRPSSRSSRRSAWSWTIANTCWHRDDTCAKCHERYKEQGTAQADKAVTYTDVNHLACDSCHTSASHAYRGDRLLPMTDQSTWPPEKGHGTSLPQTPDGWWPCRRKRHAGAVTTARYITRPKSFLLIVGRIKTLKTA